MLRYNKIACAFLFIVDTSCANVCQSKGDLDFLLLSSQVVDILKGIVGLAFDPKDQSIFLSDPRKGLRKLRRWCSQASQGGEYLREYLGYLKRESTICQHIHDVLDKIRDATSGKNGNGTVLSTFNMGSLERELNVPVNSTEEWAETMCKLLGLLVGIRDWVPRSQLIFTLELALRNSHSVKQKLDRIGGRPAQQEAPTQVDNTTLSGGSVESEGEEEAPLFDIFHDDSDNASPTRASAEESRGPFSGIENRLIAAHEHITQLKFNKESVGILDQMAKRKRFKNNVEWMRTFHDSDSEDEGTAAQGGVTSAPQRGGAGDESDEEDDVVEDSHRVRTLGPAAITTEEFDDDELDLPLQTECDSTSQHDALFPSMWGYGPPIFSSFCTASVLLEHIPIYHVPVISSVQQLLL